MSTPNCPLCKKPASEKHKPFCSKRCADIDLGRWLKGNYVVPGPAIDESEGLPANDPSEAQD